MLTKNCPKHFHGGHYMLKKPLDKILNTAVENGDVPGVIALVSNRTETIYNAGFGIDSPTKKQPMDANTVIWIASMSKAITSAAAMQLVERNQLSLDTFAENILPELKDIKVLEGFSEDGLPILRPPESKITVLHLLTHTAGFGYDIWHSKIRKFMKKTNIPSRSTGKRESLLTPLMFDPGTRWEYSIGIDWVGLIVEKIARQTLGSYLNANIFEPLRMYSTGFLIDGNMKPRLAVMYKRESGILRADPTFIMKQQPDVESGGGGLYSTVNDYAVFLRMLLNNGKAFNQQILKAETIEKMFKNQIGENKVVKLHSSYPAISRDAEFFPGIHKTWGLSFMINEEDTATGRPAGSLGWAGLSNCYFWIDPLNNIAGIFGAQVLPFIDEKAFPLFSEFEKTVYRLIQGKITL
jgi:methyl acetate hydrolase